MQEFALYKCVRSPFEKKMVRIIDEAEWNEICRRASGRRRYNAHRKFLAELRRLELVKLFKKYDPFEWGSRRKYAEELGVSEATISRDIAKLIYIANHPDPNTPAAWRRRWAFDE